MMRWVVVLPRVVSRPGRSGGLGVGRRTAARGTVCLVLLLALPGVVVAGSVPPRIEQPCPSLSSQRIITSVHEYEIEASSILTYTTSSGSMWVVERRITYGDASIVIMVMALCLITVFDILLRLAVLRV